MASVGIISRLRLNFLERSSNSAYQGRKVEIEADKVCRAPVMDKYVGPIGTLPFSPKRSLTPTWRRAVKQDILVKLKSTEEETARRIEQAKARASDLLKDARRRAEEIRREALEEAQRDQADQLKRERSDLEKARDRTLQEGKAREEKVRAQYQKNADAYVKRSLDVFARSLDA